jgi:hypothetical protein
MLSLTRTRALRCVHGVPVERARHWRHALPEKGDEMSKTRTTSASITNAAMMAMKISAERERAVDEHPGSSAAAQRGDLAHGHDLHHAVDDVAHHHRLVRTDMAERYASTRNCGDFGRIGSVPFRTPMPSRAARWVSAAWMTGYS